MVITQLSKTFRKLHRLYIYPSPNGTILRLRVMFPGINLGHYISFFFLFQIHSFYIAKLTTLKVQRWLVLYPSAIVFEYSDENRYKERERKKENFVGEFKIRVGLKLNLKVGVTQCSVWKIPLFQVP
jgi:hypothetical protein